MIDREKVINDLVFATVMTNVNGSEYVALMPQTVSDIIALLKEQEKREERICKAICDFIRGCCSTDTDDDKDFVCYEIQKCFVKGR